MKWTALKEETINVIANTQKNQKNQKDQKDQRVIETLEPTTKVDWLNDKNKFATLEDIKHSFQKTRPVDLDTKSDDFRFKNKELSQQDYLNFVVPSENYGIPSDLIIKKEKSRSRSPPKYENRNKTDFERFKNETTKRMNE